ncbi:MAG: hypothetical protein ABS939_20365 [Psychrobacillus sp.]
MVFSIEELYEMRTYLNNLLMVKYAHEFGIDVKKILTSTSIVPHNYSMDNTCFETFLQLSRGIFEEIDYFYPGENSEDFDYWLKVSVCTKKYDQRSCYLWVFMDSRLSSFSKATNLYSTSDLEGDITLYPMELGIVAVGDEDYGECDWTNLYEKLLAILKENETKASEMNKHLESATYEMAI